MRRDRPGLTSNADYLRALQELIAAPIDLRIRAKTAREGRTWGFLVREGFAVYVRETGKPGGKAIALAITGKGTALWIELTAPTPIE